MKFCSLPACFPDLNVLWVPMECLLELGAGTEQLVGGRKFEEERRSVRSCRGGCRGRGGCRKYLTAELGMSLGNWIWRRRGRSEDLWIPRKYHFSHLLEKDFFLTKYVLNMISLPSTPSNFPPEASLLNPLPFCFSLEKSKSDT